MLDPKLPSIPEKPSTAVLAEYVKACGYPATALLDGSALDVRWETSTQEIEGSEVTVLQAAWDSVGPISGPKTSGVVVVDVVRAACTGGRGGPRK